MNHMKSLIAMVLLVTAPLSAANDTDPGTLFCFGTVDTCPCGNGFGLEMGCANSTCSGATLSGSGTASISADDLTLTAVGLTRGPGLFFQGDTRINRGVGTPFGDGLRCVGGEIKRLEVRFSELSQASTTVSIADRGEVQIGETKRYQCWYRDPNVWLCDNGFNLTNGYEVTWTL